MAHYEGGTLIPTCTSLNIGMEEPVDLNAKRVPGKRGPQPKVAQQLERIQALPAAKQRAISQVLDSVLAAHQ